MNTMMKYKVTSENRDVKRVHEENRKINSEDKKKPKKRETHFIQRYKNEKMYSVSVSPAVSFVKVEKKLKNFSVHFS